MSDKTRRPDFGKTHRVTFGQHAQRSVHGTSAETQSRHNGTGKRYGPFVCQAWSNVGLLLLMLHMYVGDGKLTEKGDKWTNMRATIWIGNDCLTDACAQKDNSH